MFLFFGILINKRARTHDYDYAAMGDEGGARGTGGSSRNRSRDLLGVEHNERDEDVPRESRFEYLPLFPQILICNAKNKKKKTTTTTTTTTIITRTTTNCVRLLHFLLFCHLSAAQTT